MWASRRGLARAGGSSSAATHIVPDRPHRTRGVLFYLYSDDRSYRALTSNPAHRSTV
jgi:hypothetical protein